MADGATSLELPSGLDDAGPSTSEENTEQKLDLPKVLPYCVRDTKAPPCFICSEMSKFYCVRCNSVFYCSYRHSRVDRIHGEVCNHLSFLYSPKPVLPKKADREKQKQKDAALKEALARKLRNMAIRMRLQKEEKQAKIAAILSAKVFMDVRGPKGEETIEALIALASICTSLRNFPEASYHLEQATSGMSKNHSKKGPIEVLVNMRKTTGLLKMAMDQPEDALTQFAEEVYLAAHYYGAEDVRTAGSYSRLADVFLRLDKFDTAASMYKQSVEIWANYLSGKVVEHDTLLAHTTHIEDVSKKKEKIMNLKIRLEAEEVLSGIYMARKREEKINTPHDLAETCYTCSMLAYVLERYSEAYNLIVEAIHHCVNMAGSELRLSVLYFYKLCKRKTEDLKRRSRTTLTTD